MRQVIIISAAVMVASISFAQEQIKQGVYSLGGSIGYSSTTIPDPFDDTYPADEMDQSFYTFMPSANYFVVDRLEVQLGLNYSFRSTKGRYDQLKEFDAGVNLGVQYYFPLGKVAPFVGGGGMVSWSNSYWGDQQASLFGGPSTTGYYLTAGLDIFISEAAAIEPAIRYTKIDVATTFAGIGIRYFIL
jgi:hypothetical protein